MVPVHMDTGSHRLDIVAEEAVLLWPLDEEERLLTLQMALKCSDLGHLAADLEVHVRCVGGPAGRRSKTVN